jgi:hypothetical protein
MKAEHLKAFNDLEFDVEDTGGGCQWLRREIGGTGGLSLVVTDGEAQLPGDEAQLFVMTDKHSRKGCASRSSN